MSLLLMRIRDRRRIATILTKNVRIVRDGESRFTADNIHDIESQIQRDIPDWLDHITEMRNDTIEEPHIEKAIQYLERGSLKTACVHLPKEEQSFSGLDTLMVIIEHLAEGKYEL